MIEMLNISAPRVTRDAALELMVHHLQLAHTYFQNIPSNAEECREEVIRLFDAQYHIVLWKDDGGLGGGENTVYLEDSPEKVAGLLWLDALEKIYEDMAD